MERLDKIGTDHSKPLSYTVEGVAEAALNIWEDYGVIIEDLHEGNYGQRDDGSFPEEHPRTYSHPRGLISAQPIPL